MPTADTADIGHAAEIDDIFHTLRDTATYHGRTAIESAGVLLSDPILWDTSRQKHCNLRKAVGRLVYKGKCDGTTGKSSEKCMRGSSSRMPTRK